MGIALTLSLLNTNMGQEKLNVSWHTYTDHLREMLHNMMTSNELTDVTLVSDDKKHFKVHKVVLSASSPVFKSIINYSSLSNPFVYLRGIESHEIESIIQFIYLGQATFYHDRMNEFLEVAKSLEIKEISKDKTENEELEPIFELPRYDPEPTKIKENIYMKPREIISHGEEQNGSAYVCNQCGKYYMNHAGLYKHRKSVHMGITYPCDECNYTAREKGSLHKHIRSVHEGVKYPCDQCNYTASEQSNLYKHVRAVHEGGKYPCYECNYKASDQGQLHRHKRSMHEGVNLSV